MMCEIIGMNDNIVTDVHTRTHRSYGTTLWIGTLPPAYSNK